jgi:hypothetical protein
MEINFAVRNKILGQVRAQHHKKRKQKIKKKK